MEWGLRKRDESNFASFFDWLSGTWPDGFALLGPWLVTGTPSGMGAASQTFLGPGDVMEATIDCLGVLRTPVGAA